MKPPAKPYSERIKKLRKSFNMTQRQLADRLGVDNTTISKWEAGIYEPNSDLLNQLAEIFETTVDNILGRAAAGPAPGDHEREFNFFETNDVQFIARSQKNLSPEAFRKMQELAKKAREIFDEDED
ncbi:helix-turn-helix transcriptional regulator [Paenibacillus albicereus]|uniref:Helix-turn-helix transcriptional regulator n=1 Tax=Paenibacillus albicereus TaxID=2726185 RepID=A0A6H2GZR8_9BACL|nr:helix-turn-helix transcriptional regulator [Paenibacillus albicereus]QJC52934.1 helix-turn-helix transcriptional regulator [Paenibacillus albicereus]